MVLPPAAALLMPFLRGHALPALPQLLALIRIETLKSLTRSSNPFLLFRGQLPETAIALTNAGALFGRHGFPALKAFADLPPLIR